ncbi:hypothetical protein [Aestuariivita sp.]|jgi:phosphate-selective porin|uniref:hypothetical protein n=1 Tax=Aestuariivita sp. TaxID=1872407 RepID=UPI002172B8ED|nr:hypothetical protein [Aestuariivita sp.]MCE8006606.1 hypothetical protein [Aestuariivita sp.]
MTIVTPEDHEHGTADLIGAFHDSIRELRIVIEDLKQQIRDSEGVDLTVASKHLAPSEALIRNCLKVEANLVDQKNRELGIAQGGYAIDLDRARFEVGCRLARLRACCTTGAVPK